MPGPCLCGCNDCRSCHPEHFRGSLYVHGLDEEEREALRNSDSTDSVGFEDLVN